MTDYISYNEAIAILKDAGGVNTDYDLRHKVRRVPGARPKRGGSPPYLYDVESVNELAARYRRKVAYWRRLGEMPLRAAVCEAWLDKKGWEEISQHLPGSQGEAIDIVIADFHLHRCAACDVLLPERAGKVCKQCIQHYHGEEAALAAAGVLDPPQVKEVKHGRMPGTLNNAAQQRRIICAALRAELAATGKVRVLDYVSRFGKCAATIKLCLHEVMNGADGEPPLNLRIPKGGRRDCVWQIWE